MNKDDVNDDFDPGIDNELGTDFGEFDQEAERGSFSDLVKKNPAVKIGMVVAALLVIIGAVTLFGGSSEKGPSSTVGAGSDLKETPGTKELSPEMKEVMDEHNQQMYEEAVKQGTSVIPQPTEPPKERLPFPAEETATDDPLLRWRQIQEERLKTQQTEQTEKKAVEDPAKAQALQALVTAMSTQMSQILSGKKIDNLKSMDVTSIADIKSRQQAEAQQAQAVAQQAAMQQANTIDPLTGQPILPAKILLPAGAIEYGQLLIEANSDIEGPIVAMVVSGPFQGSRVLGTFSTKEEYLVLQFSTLINKKGISIPINAFALDPDTTLTGMATDVDHRYWERVILPAAAEFVEGMGQAYADQQGQQTIVTGDVVVQSDPPLNTKEQVASGVEKAAEKVGDILDDEGQNTKPLIRVRAGTPLGILFMTAITDQDVVAGTTTPQTARTLQLQQQQQQSLFQQQQYNAQGQQSPMYLLQGLQGVQGLQGGQTGTSTNSAGSANRITPVNNNTLPSNIFSTQQYLNK